MLQNQHAGSKHQPGAARGSSSTVQKNERGSTEYTRKCRVCLDTGKLPIFTAGSNIAEALSFIAGIYVSQDNHLPRFVCLKCHSLLQGGMMLRKTAQRTELMLKQITFLDNLVSEDIDMSEDDSICSIHSENGLLVEPGQSISEAKPTGNTDTSEDDSIHSEDGLTGEPEQSISEVKPTGNTDTSEDDSIHSEDGSTGEPEQSISEVKPTGNTDTSEDDSIHSEDGLTGEPEQSISEVKPTGNTDTYEDDSMHSEDGLTGEPEQSMKTEHDVSKPSEEMVVITTDISDDDNLSQCESKGDHQKNLAQEETLLVECDICKVSILISEYLEHYIKEHARGNVKRKRYYYTKLCEICGKELYSKDSYLFHRIIHLEDYLCDHCSYRGQNKELLVLHMTSSHRELYAFKPQQSMTTKHDVSKQSETKPAGTTDNCDDDNLSQSESEKDPQKKLPEEQVLFGIVECVLCTKSILKSNYQEHYTAEHYIPKHKFTEFSRRKMMTEHDVSNKLEAKPPGTTDLLLSEDDSIYSIQSGDGLTVDQEQSLMTKNNMSTQSEAKPAGSTDNIYVENLSQNESEKDPQKKLSEEQALPGIVECVICTKSILKCNYQDHYLKEHYIPKHKFTEFLRRKMMTEHNVSKKLEAKKIGANEFLLSEDDSIYSIHSGDGLTVYQEQILTTKNNVSKQSEAKPASNSDDDNLSKSESKKDPQKKLPEEQALLGIVECVICSKSILKCNYQEHYLKEHYIPKHKFTEFLRRKMMTEHDVSKKLEAKKIGANDLILSEDLYKPKKKNTRKNYISTIKKKKVMKQTGKITTICEVCGKELSSEGSYKMHKTTHSEEFPFHCDHCPYRGRTKSLLISHMKSHSEIYAYKCAECPKRFERAGYLRIHLRCHNKEKKYKCDTCKRAFHLPCHLKEHQKFVHYGIRSIVCNICNKYFVRRNQLTSHQRRIHKRERIQKGSHASYFQAERRS